MDSSTTKSAFKILFVNRQSILNDLEEMADCVEREQRPLYAFIYGEAGIGKTSIIQKFLESQELKHSNNLRVLRVEASEINDLPFLPFLIGVEKFRKNNKDLTNDAVRFASNFISCIPEIGPYAKAAIDALVSLRTLSNMDKSQTTEYAIFSNLSRMIESESKKRLLIIYVDDAHWLDETSLSLLDYITSYNKKTGILFIIAARKPPYSSKEIKIQHGLDNIYARLRGRSKRLEVKPLTVDDCGDLICQFTGTRGKDRKYTHRMHCVTNGNPYKIRHVMEYSITGNQDIPEFSKLEDQRFNEIRMDLPESEKILAYAVALGYRFYLPTLSKLLEMDNIDVFRTLSTLEHKYGLLIDLGSKYFTFDHYSTYEDIRRRLGTILDNCHLKVAELLEKNVCDPPNNYLLAYHYSQTQYNEKTLKYMRSAASASISGNLFIDASERLENCLEIAEDLNLKSEEISSIKVEYARALLEENKVSRSMDILEELVDGAHVNMDKKARCHTLLSKCHRLRGEAESGKKALFHARTAVSMVQGSDTKSIGDAYAYLATVCDHFGSDTSETMRAYRMATKCYQEHPLELAQLQCKSGIIRKSQLAIMAMKKSLPVLKDGNMNIMTARCLNNIGAEYLYIGEFEESRTYLNRSLEMFRVLGTHEVDTPLNNLGLYHLQEGEHGTAMQKFEEALDRSSEKYNETAININMSTVHRKNGNLQEASKILDEVEEWIMKCSEPTLQDYYGFNRSIVHREREEWSASKEWLRKFPVNTYKNDLELAEAKRTRALLETCKHEEATQEVSAEEKAKMESAFTTERLQKWFYEEDYYPCDIHMLD